MKERQRVIQEARFDQKYIPYTFWVTLFLFIAAVGTIPLIPFWILGWGQWYSRASLKAMRCVLTDQSVIIHRGIFFRKEKNIPLEKITDITLKQGPLMRRFGLERLVFETAGQNNNGSAEGSLLGLVDARAFSDAVRSQREWINEQNRTTQANGADKRKTLDDIYEMLERIEDKL